MYCDIICTCVGGDALQLFWCSWSAQETHWSVKQSDGGWRDLVSIDFLSFSLPPSLLSSPSLPPSLPLSDFAVAHTFLQQVLCRAQATLPITSSPTPLATVSVSTSHRREVLETCISDLQCISSLDDQLSDRAECAATFLKCQLLSEKVLMLMLC